jgi:hypothetical protein
VPAGTTNGCGSGAAGAGADVADAPGELLIAFPPAAFDGAAMSWLAELDAVSAGFFEQATSVNIRKMDNKYSARERMIFSSRTNLLRPKL